MLNTNIVSDLVRNPQGKVFEKIYLLHFSNNVVICTGDTRVRCPDTNGDALSQATIADRSVFGNSSKNLSPVK